MKKEEKKGEGSVEKAMAGMNQTEGPYRQLLELRLEYEENYSRYLRMDVDMNTETVLLAAIEKDWFFTPGAKKLHLPPLLSRNLSHNTSFSIDIGYIVAAF